MSLLRSVIFLFLLSPVILLLIRCANPVMPQGGPKDVSHPVMVTSVPENFSTQFSDDKILITFDEFLQLKDQSREISISPPQEVSPDIKVNGKNLTIKFNESLLIDHTYTINFGNSICDMREGNPCKDFRFVFSTGSYIDSLTIKGKVINSFDNTIQKEVKAMLYAPVNDTLPVDSLPLYFKPSYLANTDDDGNFEFENIRDGRLLLFALKDQNGNGFFDLPNEKIAFLDSLIEGTYIPVIAELDSVTDALTDSIQPVMIDSIIKPQENIPFYTLRLFEEIDSTQKILKSTLVKKDQIAVYFRFPTRDSRIRPLNINVDSAWTLKEINPSKDSLFLWLLPNTLDSMILEISDNNRVLDTARISLIEKSVRKKKDPGEKNDLRRITFSTNFRNGILNQFIGNPSIIFSYPVVKADFPKVLLIQENDTLPVSSVFTDSVKRNLTIKYPWKEDKKYRIVIPDSAFFSMNNLTHDTVFSEFRTQNIRDLGSIKINLSGNDSLQKYIIQLISDKGGIAGQQYITGQGKAYFEYLSPGKYKLKCLIDRNKNNRWDTGNYRKKLQPEKIEYFPTTIEVRANWDIEESWEIKSTGN